MSKSTNLPKAPSTAGQAVAESRYWAERSRNGATPFPRLCLQHVRMDWDLPPVYGTARIAWERSLHKHRHQGAALREWEKSIPFGAPVFSGIPGGNDAGHVFIAGGRFKHGPNAGRRIMRSNDVLTLGGVAAVTLDFFVERWGHDIWGWTHDLNGFWLPLDD